MLEPGFKSKAFGINIMQHCQSQILGCEPVTTNCGMKACQAIFYYIETDQYFQISIFIIAPLTETTQVHLDQLLLTLCLSCQVP